MSDYLPPLNALRAFDAAARHMSFAKAAEELAVTPAALSLQIKNLEAHLGEPVFHRLNRAVALTEAGRNLLPFVSDAFEALNLGWRSARRALDSGKLTVTAGPAFTAKWLAPRMFRFAQANSDIELRFSASLRMMDFARDEIDLAIRFGRGDDNGLFSENVFEEWVTPMMHPSLVEKFRDPSELLSAPLIHDDSMSFMKPNPNWETWFKMAGQEWAPDHGPRFSNGDHAIDAAQEGEGVVLGRASLCDRALRDGRLVAPFSLAVRFGAHYRIVCPLGSETRPPIARFRAWMDGEMQTLRDLTAKHRPVPISVV